MGLENKMPENWIKTTLGDVADKVFSGGTPNTRNPEFWDGAYNWLASGETGLKYIYRTNKSITKLGVKNSSTRLALKDDIVVATAGQGNTRGQVSYLFIDSYINQSIIAIRGNKEIVFNKWLFYNLSDRYKELRFISESNSVRGSLTTKMINNLLSLNLPALIEQKAIANVLTAFDDKIEQLQQQNTTLESIAQTIFKEWFGKYQLGDELPEGWRVGKLGDIATHLKQNVKPFNKPNKEFYHFSLPAYDNGLKPVTENGKEILSSKYLVKDKCFLVSKLNPFTPRIWTIIESEENSICSTEFQVVKPVEDVSFTLVHCFLNSEYFTSELSQKVQGTSSSHQRVKPQDIFDVELILPNKEKLIEFGSIVKPFLLKKNINHKQIQSLTKTRDALLPKLMNGQVRVKM